MLPTTLTFMAGFNQVLLLRVKIYYEIMKHDRFSQVYLVILNLELSDIWLWVNMYVHFTKETKVLESDQCTKSHLVQQASNPALSKA